MNSLTPAPRPAGAATVRRSASAADPAAPPPRTSVVILTYARDEVLATTLAALRTAIGARDDVEVVLVDNNEDQADRSALLAPFAAWQWVRTGWNKGVSARNDGMDIARGEVIALLDDDVLVETQGFLERFEAVFARYPQVGVVTVRKLEARSRTQLVECIPHSSKSVDATLPFFTFRFTGGLIGFRRGLHQQLGGFSPEFFYGAEEREYAYRVLKAGWKIYYEPAIIAIETNAGGGRRSRSALMTETLANNYIISFLHKPLAVMLAHSVMFTGMLILRERGRIDLIRAGRLFAAWLARPDRARRQPLDRGAEAYIRACGGSIWR